MKTLTAGMKRRIKSEWSKEKPTIQIGKKQVSQELLKEIEKQLEKREVVKVKILKSALQKNDAKKIALMISKEIDAAVVEVRGHTFILYRRRRKRLRK